MKNYLLNGIKGTVSIAKNLTGSDESVIVFANNWKSNNHFDKVIINKKSNQASGVMTGNTITI